MLASLPIGWLCFRLRGPYFTIATIATAQALMLIFLKFRDFAWRRGHHVRISAARR
jgi:branched-chain amino acid transport system permease protein